ncbi:MAG: DUF72 domain-containing protein [Candidatus Sumerlaeia bacterium]|nr:DUF72 domain-containing protein [Candidatus Sumerlaeia bacterium]
MTAAAQVRLGSAGWSYADWEGIVYPARKPAGFHPLRHLARWISVAEVNASFYRIPAPEHARAWTAATADLPRLRFTAKLYRGLSHDAIGGDPDPAQLRAMHAFLDALAESGRFDGLLLQFPFRLHATGAHWAHVARLLDEFAAHPRIVEFRHAGWWQPRVFEELERRGATLASIDQPALPHNIPPELVATGPVAYIRFHGRNAANWWRDGAGDARYDYLYTPAEIHDWAERIKALLPRGKLIQAIFNNHVRGQGLANALALARALGMDAPPPPDALAQRYPALFPDHRGAAEHQGELFGA